MHSISKRASFLGIAATRARTSGAFFGIAVRPKMGHLAAKR
jgi:hypothetical protein